MSEEALCQTCGDRGFPEALSYCIKCEAAAHTYCLDELPEDLSQDVSWTCEHCMSKSVEDSIIENFSDVPVVKGRCMVISKEEAPYTRRKKRRRSITYSTYLKKKRKNRDSHVKSERKYKSMASLLHKGLCC